NNFIQWRDLKEEQTKLQSEVLPRLQVLDLRESINGARSHIQGSRRLLREKQRLLAAEEDTHAALDMALRAAQEREEAMRLAEKSAGEVFQTARETVVKTAAVLEQRDNLVALS